MTKSWVSIVSATLIAIAGNAGFASDLPTTRSIAAVPHHSAHKHAVGQKSASTKEWQQESANREPFVNNHYVLTGSFPVNGYHKGTPVVVIVDKSSHFTHVLQLQNEKIVRVMTISNAIGSIDKPTPPGRYTVSQKKMYPSWLPPKTIDPEQKVIPPYNQTHKNPLGVAAIYLNKFDIDLHGTNEPKMIRQSASHGCVRHSNADILKLYQVVNPGDVVYIVNKFRGKVLQRSDFVKTHKVAENGTDAPAERQVQKPSSTEKRKHRNISLVWYTVDT